MTELTFCFVVGSYLKTDLPPSAWTTSFLGKEDIWLKSGYDEDLGKSLRASLLEGRVNSDLSILRGTGSAGREVNNVLLISLGPE